MGNGPIIHENDCRDAVVRSMAAYIRQLEGEIDIQQLENKRLSDKIAELQKSLKSFNDDVLSKICGSGWPNSRGDSISGIISRIQLDSDKDPFVNPFKEDR